MTVSEIIQHLRNAGWAVDVMSPVDMIAAKKDGRLLTISGPELLKVGSGGIPALVERKMEAAR